jgi:hypothetical protein
MSYRDRDDFAKETGETLRTIRGMVRRFAIALTQGKNSIWQFVGVRSPIAGDEVRQLEVFPGIGFFSRPSQSGRPEAIATAIAGAAKGLVAVATRDEKTLQAITSALPNGELAEDETIVYSGAALVHVRANGTVEIRTPGPGTPLPLATLKDIVELREWIASHSHPSNGSAPNPPDVPTPSGTTVLKAK